MYNNADPIYIYIYLHESLSPYYISHNILVGYTIL